MSTLRYDASLRIAGLTLGAFAMLAALSIAIASIYIGFRSYTPVLFADEWQVPMDYMALNGHYGIAKLWAQHNEHRIPFQKLLQLVDMFWWKSNHRPLIVFGWLVQTAQCGAFAYFLRKIAGLTSAEFVTALSLVIFCVFNPDQMQIFEWAFSPSLLGSFLAAVLAFGALSMFSKAGRTSWLIVALVCAFLAECNLASGVLVWPMLFVSAILLRLSRRVIAILAAFAVFGVGSYLIGYHSPPNATNPIEGIQHPIQIAAFCQAYFAESFRFISPTLGNFAADCGLILLATALIHSFVRRGPDDDRPEMFVLSIALMMILTSFITALGRQISGVAQAREGRYQVPAMLFWAALGLWVLFRASRLGRFRTPALLTFQILFIVVASSEALALPAILHQYAQDRFMRNIAGLSYEASVQDFEAERSVYPYPPAVEPAYNYLVAKRWIKPPFPEYEWVGRQLNQAVTVPAGQNCAGYTDEIREISHTADIRQLLISGWAYNVAGQIPVQRLIAVSDSDQILGIGISGGERLDVPQVAPSIKSVDTGWRIYAKVPNAVKELSIYAVLPGTNQACLITSKKAVR